ncbi:MAG: hypothetical protein ACJA2Q_001179 [Pseudohongiellaceae bacterium]|jgi:hypothetical protein
MIVNDTGGQSRLVFFFYQGGGNKSRSNYEMISLCNLKKISRFAPLPAYENIF